MLVKFFNLLHEGLNKIPMGVGKYLSYTYKLGGLGNKRINVPIEENIWLNLSVSLSEKKDKLYVWQKYYLVRVGDYGMICKDLVKAEEMAKQLREEHIKSLFGVGV